MFPVLPPAQIQEAQTPPAAPLLATPLPALDREITLSGFKGIQLKASIREASGHACFAVLVADSGPTDRDWSSSLLRDPRNGAVIPSHGGRDFAAWLQDRGIGSLRYDKRFLGSRDPKLDVSLEAQVGDLRAILKAVRELPEAKGRKLLLVGHGEGALLSLLAASDADALLLLAMPGRSMARTLVDQLRLQLPSDLVPVNTGYLETVLQAIREGKPTPPAGAKVLPAMVPMAKALMAPESLDFVRATLDLDPWALAAHLAIPTAVAWGDRDVQSPRPDKIPPSYPGRVIALPGANHLLKREERAKELLTGPEAVATYGDGTPLADLGPLAEWLDLFTGK